jgi:D-glycero-alpha-D-manno-heptose-7-phosphate kinase
VGLVGGGSDLPEFFSVDPDGGSVLGMTINLYVYTSILPLSSVARERIRLTYRQTESVDQPEDLEHPVVRAVLLDRKCDKAINIATMSDVPGGTGLGSSSSFTVGLIAALDAFEGIARSPSAIAKEAVRVERELLGEAGGWQDQYHAAVGGFRRYDFNTDGVAIHPVIDPAIVAFLRGWVVLVSTRSTRESAAHQKELATKVKAEIGRHDSLTVGALRDLANLSRDAYSRFATLEKVEHAPYLLAEVLNEGWRLKKGSGVNSSSAEEILQRGMSNGALAGKLCGAGGGGFVLLLVESSKRAHLRQALAEYVCIDVEPDDSRAQVTKI